MSTNKWDFIKKFGKKDPQKPNEPQPAEAIPLKKTNQGSASKPQDIELAGKLISLFIFTLTKSLQQNQELLLDSKLNLTLRY